MIVVALAGLWLQQHADDPNRGLKENITNALQQLDDLKTNSWYESDVDDTVQHEVDILEKQINTFSKYANQFLQLVDEAYKPISLNDQEELQKLQESIGSNAKTIVEGFKKSVEELAPLIVAAINKFSDREYQLTHTKPSWIGNISGWAGEALHGRWGLIANDFISAVNALNPLKGSLMSYYDKAKSFDEVKGRFQDKIEATIGKSDEKDGEKKESGGFMDGLFEFLGHKPNLKELEFFKSLE